MRPRRPITHLAAAAWLGAAPPASGQDAASSPSSPTACTDRSRLEAEHAAVKKQITDVALAGSDRRSSRRGAGAGRTAFGAATSLLLPFGVGLALSGGVALAEAAAKKANARKPPPPPPPEPDIPRLIERQAELEAELAALTQAGCAPAVAGRGQRG